jgi:hypothetical protein
MDVENRGKSGRRGESSKSSLTIVIPPSFDYDTTQNRAGSFSSIESEGKVVWCDQLNDGSLNIREIENLMILVTPSDHSGSAYRVIHDTFKDHPLTRLKIAWVTDAGELGHTSRDNSETKQSKVPKIAWSPFDVAGLEFSALELESCPGMTYGGNKGSTITITLSSEAKRIDIANSSATCLAIIVGSPEGSKLESINLSRSGSISSIGLSGDNASSVFRMIKESINAEKKDSIKIRRDNKTILFSDSDFSQMAGGFFGINIPRDSFHTSDPSSRQSLDPLLRQSSDQSPSSSKSYSSQSPGKSRTGCCCPCIDE